MSRGRRGPILAGTWLIGLGIVLLLQGALGSVRVEDAAVG